MRCTHGQYGQVDSSCLTQSHCDNESLPGITKCLSHASKKQLMKVTKNLMEETIRLRSDILELKPQCDNYKELLDSIEQVILEKDQGNYCELMKIAAVKAQNFEVAQIWRDREQDPDIRRSALKDKVSVQI